MDFNEKRIIMTDDEKGGAALPKNSVYNTKTNFNDAFSLPKRFSSLSRVVLRDLNHQTSSPRFYKYTKDDIARFLRNPYQYQKSIRDAVTYVYGASSHFRRLIQYFTSLSDLVYVLAPYKTDTATARPKTTRRNFYKTLNMLSSMDIKNQFAKVLTVCLREDVFYGTLWVTSESITLQQLPSDYCSIAVVENNVLNVSFDFSYFNSHLSELDNYPEEFRRKYNLYISDKTNLRWQELDAPNSFAIKCNNDITTYAIPPFAGILRDIYDLEDYRDLKMTKTELENYALLVMKLGINSDGEWEMDLDKAKEFWRNLDSVMPEEVGTILSPMEITKIGFEKSNTGDTDTLADAEENVYTAAGVSSLLFNNRKAAASALLLSIKVDQALTYGIVKSIETALNRFIRAQSYGKYFNVTFLDCSPFNRKEVGDAYIKACQFGLPMISYYAASQGMSQSDLDGMNYLENDVLGFNERFVPLRSSATQSASGNEPGRPQSEDGDLSEEGEKWREGQ